MRLGKFFEHLEMVDDEATKSLEILGHMKVMQEANNAHNSESLREIKHRLGKALQAVDAVITIGKVME